MTSNDAVVLQHFTDYARSRRMWRDRGRVFHREDEAYLQFMIPPGMRVLEIGSGLGDTFAALKPSYGVGIDFCPEFIDQAKLSLHPLCARETPVVICYFSHL